MYIHLKPTEAEEKDWGAEGSLTSSHSESLGFTCNHLVCLGFIWFHLASFRFNPFHLVSLSINWFRLVSHGPTWSWIHLDGVLKSIATLYLGRAHA